ncbi:MAG TPA: glycerophosphodiester phosphodiesterase family protein [Gemmatales bacterium]|nr:glycerophosphodiester phosphodiesterase family protein [Gemmatales bacterium]
MLVILLAHLLLLPTEGKPMYPHPKINIGHRGACAYAPEHTLASYRLALEMKADFVEPDLQVTKDGVLICMHDATLERTTNVKKVFPDRSKEIKRKQHWVVADFTLAEIKTLDAGSWFDKKFAGEKVPTLQEMIELVRGKAGIIPETKSPEAYDKSGLSMEKLLMDLLKKNGLDRPGADPKTPVVVQSFSLPSLQKMKRELKCELPLLYLFENSEELVFTSDFCKKLKLEVDGVGLHKELVQRQPGLVKLCHEAGLTVTIFTCRSRKTAPFPDVKTEMKHYLDLGVDAIFTDNPDQFPRK